MGLHPAPGGTPIPFNRVEQEENDLGVVSGALVIDMTMSNIRLTLGGNVTSVSFSNDAAADRRTTTIINVIQDATTPYTINWTGSGILPEKGKASIDYQPNTDLGSLTEYWGYWTGAEYTMNKVERGNAL